MKRRISGYLGIAVPLTIAGIVGFSSNSVVFAQLTPDNTLGAESSIVTPQQLRDFIQGGATRGNALFHSFEDFNVSLDREVFFDLQNNPNILNILTRVTGSNSSNILGTLGVLQDALNSDALGDANLFLLNPNGITFGENARLQMNGSFFATTADSFDFDDFTFSASGKEAPPPLLTVNIPRFLSFRDNPGGIVHRGDLRVEPGNTVGFLGGEVEFIGAIALVRDGRIEIGAVDGNASVSLTETNLGYVLGYEGVETFQDITLRESDGGERSILNANRLNANVEGGNSIQLQGRNIRLSGQALVRAGIRGSLDGGDLTINSDRLVIEEASEMVIDVFGSGGDAGNIIINTGELFVQSRGFINAITFGEGDGANITINATDVQVIDIPSDTEDRNFGRIFVQALDSAGFNSTGDAGDLNINTARLLIRGGGIVNTSTAAQGNAGNILINASESVQIIGEAQDGSNPSNLFSESGIEFLGDDVNANILGNAGNITINTPQLLLQDGGQISVATRTLGDGGTLTVNANDVQIIGISPSGLYNSALLANAGSTATGDAGDVTISTTQLLLQYGGQISTATSGFGDAGDIKLNVDDTILIEGIGSGIFSSAESGSTGIAGSITIDPQQVTIRDGGTISVNSQGEGKGGDIFIISDNLTLDNGSITAQTANTDGGNIDLDIAELLLLRNGDGISAAARGEGDGGNLIIDTTFLVAFPEANSDMSANASQGKGGNININATGIYGIQFRDATTDFSDITASSEFGISGTVNLNTPEIQLHQELINLPEEVVDASDMVTQSACYDFGGGSQFSNSGRGGVPQIPGFIIRNDVVEVDLVDEVPPAPPPEAIKPHHRTDVIFIDSEGEEFKPAMGAVLLPNGMVEFVDYNPAEVYRDMYAAAGCNQFTNK